MLALNHAASRLLLLPYCFPLRRFGAGKQELRKREPTEVLNYEGSNGAGEGIRTLDPNLGNFDKRLFQASREYANLRFIQ